MMPEQKQQQNAEQAAQLAAATPSLAASGVGSVGGAASNVQHATGQGMVQAGLVPVALQAGPSDVAMESVAITSVPEEFAVFDDAAEILTDVQLLPIGVIDEIVEVPVGMESIDVMFEAWPVA